eukprot:UN34002
MLTSLFRVRLMSLILIFIGLNVIISTALIIFMFQRIIPIFIHRIKQNDRPTNGSKYFKLWFESFELSSVILPCNLRFVLWD